MAERRMFAKTIIDSDAFLDMPLSTQALYFHLSMRGDDEGFINNPKKIQRMIGASDDDMKVLLAKNFIIEFESGVIVIKHWKIHNYIRADRLVKTKYEDERALLELKENGSYTIKSDLNTIPAKETRKIAYKESDLPNCFGYKIRRAFNGKKCPLCGCLMTDSYKQNPTVQHNIPLSKGGTHTIDNISIICESCNYSIKDKETDALNNAEVVTLWNKILIAEESGIDWFSTPETLEKIDDGHMTDIWQADGRQTAGRPPHRLGKDSIGKYSIGKYNGDSDEPLQAPQKPKKKKYGEYQCVTLTDAEYDRLREDFGEAITTKAIDAVDKYCRETGKRYKDYNLTIRRWGIDAAKKIKDEPPADENYAFLMDKLAKEGVV